MGCTKICLKYLLFLFNFIFWLSGLAILVAGATIQISYQNYVAFLGGGVVSVPVILIILGTVIGIIGFFGCCGAIRENYCLNMTYLFLLIVIFIIEFGAAIACYVLRGDLNQQIKHEAVKGLYRYGMSHSGGLTKGWDAIHKGFHCCGVQSYRDWNGTSEFIGTYDVPDSCCKNISATCGAGARDPIGTTDFIYTKGCIDSFIGWVKQNVAIVGGVSACIAAIQIVGMVLACCFARSLREGYKSM